MKVLSIATMLPVPSTSRAAAALEALLGVAPSFVDGERWAQFDIEGRRLALAGTDRVSARAGLMVKVDDLDAALARARQCGLPCGETETGPHERRAVVEGPGGWPLVLYAAKPG